MSASPGNTKLNPRLATLCLAAVAGGYGIGALGLRADHTDLPGSVRTASTVALLLFAWVLPPIYGFVGVRFTAPRPVGPIIRHALAPVVAQLAGFAVGIQLRGVNFWWFLAITQPLLALATGALAKKQLARR